VGVQPRPRVQASGVGPAEADDVHAQPFGAAEAPTAPVCAPVKSLVGYVAPGDTLPTGTPDVGEGSAMADVQLIDLRPDGAGALAEACLHGQAGVFRGRGYGAHPARRAGPGDAAGYGLSLIRFS
jgi:hypothetical protein